MALSGLTMLVLSGVLVLRPRITERCRSVVGALAAPEFACKWRIATDDSQQLFVSYLVERELPPRSGGVTEHACFLLSSSQSLVAKKFVEASG